MVLVQKEGAGQRERGGGRDAPRCSHRVRRYRIVRKRHLAGATRQIWELVIEGGHRRTPTTATASELGIGVHGHKQARRTIPSCPCPSSLVCRESVSTLLHCYLRDGAASIHRRRLNRRNRSCRQCQCHERRRKGHKHDRGVMKG